MQYGGLTEFVLIGSSKGKERYSEKEIGRIIVAQLYVNKELIGKQ